MSETSKNERASKVFGMRADRIGDAIILDQPCELGYHCPVCVYQQMSPDGMMYDERLHWSEYNSFIWCEVCDFDYPSALCLPHDPKKATEIFLDSVEEKINEHAVFERETEAMRDFMALLYLGIQEGRDEAFEALDDKTKKLINEVWFEKLEEEGEDD